MESTSVRVNARYEERIRIKHLAMEPSLQGATATFLFEDHDVEIRLPTLPPEDQRHSERAEAEADTWNSDGEIARVYIYAMCVTLPNLTFELPSAAASYPHINVSLYSGADARELDERSDKIYFTARRAVDYWLRVARWKTGLGLIDFDTRSGNATLRGGRLFNNAHGGAFYSPRIGRTVVGLTTHILNPTTWQEIALAVSAGLTPPLWIEYLMSGQRRIEQGDLTAATIDLAIAAESVIRRSVDEKLPPSMPEKERSKMGRVPMGALLDRWDKFGLPTRVNFPWFKDIKTLTEVRNGIMHTGNDWRVQPAFCRLVAAAVEHLISALA